MILHLSKKKQRQIIYLPCKMNSAKARITHVAKSCKGAAIATYGQV